MADSTSIRVPVDGPEWLIVESVFPSLPPEQLMPWFVDASRLNLWWGEEAMIEPRPGGRYIVRWPAMGWTMRGVVAFCDETCLAYSWTWDHESQQPPRSVTIRAQPAGEGSILTITHGPYRPESTYLVEENSDRIGHRDGWLFFLEKLHATIAQSSLG